MREKESKNIKGGSKSQNRRPSPLLSSPLLFAVAATTKSHSFFHAFAISLSRKLYDQQRLSCSFTQSIHLARAGQGRVTCFEKTMSWLSNYLFGQYSDSYEGTAISDSYEKPVSSNLRETEVVSGIRYRDNTVKLDLNTPVEDPYAQQGYSNFGYGGEYNFVQQECYPNDSYGCQQSLQGYSNFGYGGEQSFVQQECYPNQSYGCEQSFERQVYSNLGDDDLSRRSSEWLYLGCVRLQGFNESQLCTQKKISRVCVN
ncbi:hypothetical protein Hanom_Chr15g01402341 [Helianthus anomalus]